MTYTAEQHTATLARWANTWGLAWSPSRSHVVWSADASGLSTWECWDNVSRTYVSSGTLDVSIATNNPGTGVADGDGFVLTNDGYLYTTSGALGSWVSTLTRFSAYGAGTQEDMGTVSNHGVTTTCAGVRLVVAGDGKQYIGSPSWSNGSDGYLFCHDTPSTPPVFLDTSVGTGHDWQIKEFVVDASGDIWAIGGLGSLSSTTIAFWRVVNVSAISRTDYFTATLPTALTGSIFTASAFHHSGASGTHFVICTQDGHLITVDYSGVVAHTVTGPIGDASYDIPVQMHLPATGDAIFWVENTQYSASDLSTVSTLDYALWGYASFGNIQQGTFYDSQNKALFVGLENSNQHFAWLFLPVAAPVKRGSIRMRRGKRLAWGVPAQSGGQGGGSGSTSGSGSSPVPTIPVSIQSKPILLTAWNTQTTAGLSNPSATFKNPVTNAAELLALGWNLTDIGSGIIYTAGDCDLSDWDWTNGGAGYEFIDIATVPTAKVFRNNKFRHAPYASHNRLWNYAQRTGCAGWTVDYYNCDVDLANASPTVNGALVDGPAGNEGKATFHGSRLENATTAYDGFGYSDIDYIECYLGPVGIGSDPAAHLEFSHCDGGLTQFIDSMCDWRGSQSVAGGLTGFAFAEGFNAGTTAHIKAIRSIFPGASEVGPTGLQYTFQMISDPTATPSRPSPAIFEVIDCALSKGSIGYMGATVGGLGSVAHTATTSIDFDTSAPITVF